MKRKVMISGFFIGLLVMFLALSAIMSGGGIAATLQGFCRWYEIYLYVFIAIAWVLLREDKRNASIGERSVREFTQLIPMIALIYLIDRNPLWPEPESVPYLLVIILKLLLCAAAILLISWLFSVIFKKREKLFIALERQKYTIAVALIFLIRLVGNTNKTPNSWAAIWYLMDYSDGFGSRFFPGQLLSFIRRGAFISSAQLAIFVAASLSVLILLCAVLSNAFMRSLKEEHRFAGFFLLALYITMPANIEMLWAYSNIGLTESFVLLFLMLAVLLFEAIKNPLPKYICAAVLSMICMACYQGYLFLYFPIMFCLLVNEYFQNKGKAQLLGGAFVCLCTAVSFILFQFFHYVNYESVDVLAMELSSRTDMDVIPDVLDFEFNRPITYHWHAFFEGNITRNSPWQMREISFTVMMLLVPLLLFFVAAWRKLFATVRDVSLIRNKYFWLLFSDCIIIIQFSLTMDWGRWYMAAFAVQFFQILYLCYKKDEGALELLSALERFVRKHPILCMMVLLWLSGLTRTEAAPQMKVASRLWKAIHKGLELLRLVPHT